MYSLNTFSNFLFSNSILYCNFLLFNFLPTFLSFNSLSSLPLGTKKMPQKACHHIVGLQQQKSLPLGTQGKVPRNEADEFRLPRKLYLFAISSVKYMHRSLKRLLTMLLGKRTTVIPYCSITEVRTASFTCISSS